MSVLQTEELAVTRVTGLPRRPTSNTRHIMTPFAPIEFCALEKMSQNAGDRSKASSHSRFALDSSRCVLSLICTSSIVTVLGALPVVPSSARGTPVSLIVADADDRIHTCIPTLTLGAVAVRRCSVAWQGA